MLRVLRVRHLAIIDALELELGPGLNVLTGETGAGKSILVDALQLVLGGRASADLVQDGAEEAVVEALFDLSALPEAARTAAEASGAAVPDGELVVRRVVRAGGGSRAYLNGALVTAGQLAQVVGSLVDICSQHEHHALTDPANHLRYLDGFADLAAEGGPLGAAEAAWRRVSDTLAALDALTLQLRERAEREAVFRFQAEEIDALEPRPGEDEALEADHARLAHAEALAARTAEAERVLYSEDGAVTERVARLVAALAPLRGKDARLDPLLDQLDEAAAALEEVARELGRYTRQVHHDPRELARISERLGALRRLARKYGGSPEAMLAHRARIQAQLGELDDLEGRVERLEADRSRAVEALVVAAEALSAKRRAASRALGEAITGELHSLGMGDARIEVDVARIEGRGGLEIAGVRYSHTGMDRVELLIAPHRGERPRPLHRIASGGELSRSLLAIKRVLAGVDDVAFQVFDEVDVGVGGGIAEAIGRKLADVGRRRQVLCITHQPAVAVYGDVHLHVHKQRGEARTQSRVKVLRGADRRDEIARMMGGIELTDATLQAADDLLAAARTYVESTAPHARVPTHAPQDPSAA
jgi:DNA repair protein RecN (Recombination protein N)